MNTITTKYGTFNVTDNDNNGAIISIGNVKITEFPKVSWWDLDSLENAIEDNIDLIQKRIKYLRSKHTEYICTQISNKE